MNITRQNIDELNAKIKIEFDKSDYEERTTKKLKEYRKNAVIPGFRPGHASIDLIKRMYGKAILLDEINNLISEKLDEYIKTENLQLLGEPIPSETDNQPIDLDNPEKFEFTFDIALKPEITIEWSKKDKITQYEIEPTDKEIDDYVESFLRNQGRYEEVDTVEGDEIIDGDLVQVNEDGQAVDNGLRIVDTFLYLYLIKDEADKEIFKSAKVGDSFIFDIKKTFPDEKIQRTILQLNDNNKTELPSLFQITVKKIRRFIKAELSTELFNRKFGEGNVTNENEFREKMKEELMNSFKYDIDYKLFNDIKDLMLKKVDIKLPENHLRRWLKYVNKEVTDEQIEKEFPLFEKSLKWQIIQSKFVAQNNLEAKTDEIIEFAKENVRYQYKLYGFDHVSDEDVTPHAMELLKQNDFIKRAISNILEKKVVDIIKQNIKIDIEKISSEKFYEMLKNGNK